MIRALRFVAVLLAVLWTVGAEEVAAQAPTVTGLSVNSPSPTDKVGNTEQNTQFFWLTEMISVTVTFSAAVDVTGTPHVVLGIGTCTTCFAEYTSGTGTTELVFTYEVFKGDEDSDGLSVAADALKLNGGTINASSGGAAATLDLGTHAFTNDATRRVTTTAIGSRNGGITGVALNSPASGNTFGNGDTILVTVTWSRSGGPWRSSWHDWNNMRAPITIGDNVRQAAHVSISGFNQILRYVVRPNDMDTDGVSGDELTGASFVPLTSSKFGHHAIRNSANHKVDGHQGPPGIIGVALSAPPGDTYGRDDTIEATVTFTQAVNVTGTPQLALGIASGTKQADYVSGTGTKSLVFRYTVVATDMDSDGISIAANALTLNSGTILQAADGTTNAQLGLGDFAVSNSADHKVNGAVLNVIVTLALSPASISENGGVSTVTATLSRTATTATMVTISATEVAPAVAGDFTLSSAKTLTIAVGQTTSTGTVTIAAADNTIDAADKRVTVSGMAATGDAETSLHLLDVVLTITDDDEPPAEPTQVSVTPGEGTLVVSWAAVSGATGYKVQWKSGDENYDAAARQAVVADGTTYTIANLIGGTEYTVRVIATRTDVDDGPPSDGVTGTPGGDGTPLPEPDTDPVFIEAVDPQTYRQNQAVELTLPEAIDGNGTVKYSLTELPDGLTFDAETRIISGTPTTPTEKAIYTVTATDEDGDTGEMSFFITVVANVAPSFGDASVDAQSYLRKQEIDSLTLPQAIGGDGTLTYALAPDLPTGLSFDAETRMLSGTPLEAIGETTYTLTATDDDGDAATLMFTLSVMADPMPAFGDTTIVAQGYQHQEFDPVTLPQASGGDGTLTYTLTPDLPDSLTFDAETRIVSGIPVKAMDETTYTLTATDGNGDTVTLMFTLEIPDLMPTFGDTTIVAQRYFVNLESESLALPQATSGDGTLAYILLPFLPDGLSFDLDTRTISGTPTEAIAEATYTFSAFDADGDVASLPFTLEVSLPSPDIDGDGNVNFADFLTFAGKYGSRIGQDRYDPRCDLNADGQIDFADFLIFAAHFGSTG